MPTYSSVTPDVIQRANRIIAKHIPFLAECAIIFIFQDEASEKDGKVVLGTAQKISDKMRAAGLHGDFIITLAKDQWVLGDDIQKDATVHHELLHCRYQEGDLSIRPHDFEEFAEIVRLYGLWRMDLRMAAHAWESAIQMRMDLGQPAGVFTIDPAMLEPEEVPEMV